MKKLDYNFVKQRFEERGYELLSKEYINSRSKLEYKCLQHPNKVLQVSYDNFKNGSGCKYCKENTKMYSYDYVKQQFELCGYILLDTEYIGTQSPMRFICPKHKDKDTSISFASLNSGTRCYYCGLERLSEIGIKKHQERIEGISDISVTHPHFINWIIDKSIITSLSIGSNRSIDLQCPDCRYLFRKRLLDCSKYGLNCPICGNGSSFPERFVFSLLESLDIKFDYRKIFNWSKRKEYDFYIKDTSTIIETHGEQHYRECNRGRTLIYEQDNDNYKYNMAVDNGIDNYIIIDCRISDVSFIKNNIINSKLNSLYNLNFVDWGGIALQAMQSSTKIACELWNTGLSTREIANKTKKSLETIRKYLHIGSELNICHNYNLSEAIKRGKIRKQT